MSRQQWVKHRAELEGRALARQSRALGAVPRGVGPAAGLTPRSALRTTKSPAKELGLLDVSVPDEALLDAMLAHPVLVNRPIVCSPKGVRLCRPSEAVLDLLETLPPGPLYKEDGQMILNDLGERVD